MIIGAMTQSRHVLRVNLNGEKPGQGWEDNLIGRGLGVLNASQPSEAISYCRAYPLMAIFVDIHETHPETLQTIREMSESITTTPRPPILAIARRELSAAEREELAGAGVDNILIWSDPQRFLIYHLETLACLAELRRFESAKTDVHELASRTRERLHDLSQPLSAIQGRLQLLAAKCPAEDPNSKYFDDMVRLVFEVTNQVMEIQQLHRKVS